MASMPERWERFCDRMRDLNARLSGLIAQLGPGQLLPGIIVLPIIYLQRVYQCIIISALFEYY